MSDVRYWGTLLEALKQTANPIDWEEVRSQRGLRLVGLGPTAESDQLMQGDRFVERGQPSSILPGRLTYVPNLGRDSGRMGVRQDLEALRRAARPLRHALITEELQSTGIPYGQNERVNILSDLWRGFVFNFEISSVEDTGGRRFDGVRITYAPAVTPTEIPLLRSTLAGVQQDRVAQKGDWIRLIAVQVVADAQQTPSVPVDDLTVQKVSKLSEKEQRAREKRFDRLNGRGMDGVVARLMKAYPGLLQDDGEEAWKTLFEAIPASTTSGRISQALHIKRVEVADEWLRCHRR